jgi:diguanylate cyclase (GGDEF)-like protein
MRDTQVNQTDPKAFLQVLGDAISEARSEAQTIGLMIIHLENFDRLVSAFGYRMGHKVVAAFAERLRETVRPQDTVVRISDSKFAVIIKALRNHGILVLAANKISQILARPIPTGPSDMTVALRMGISTGPEQASDADELLQHAETALLSALGDDTTYALYSREQSERALDSLGLELELDLAIKRAEFELYYQPKISASDFTPCGAEALLRWTTPKRGPISPEVFIPMADRAGRIEPLTSFVLNTALRQAAEWPAHFGELSVSVNVTPKVIESTDLIGMVSSAIAMWDAAPNRLFIEITEGAIMANPSASFGVLKGLRDAGMHISIDDFGTGYSSLAYFKNIPADELKVDKSFVINMFEDEGDKQIVRTIIELAKGFGLKVTAEGVEDETTAAVLSDLKCDYLQGYYYSRPLPQQQFTAWLEDYTPHVAETG